MIFTLTELFRALVITLAVGFIFKDLFRTTQFGFDVEAFKFACYVTAPAIILHELGHKFIALYFGLDATFHAAYFWLAIGVLLKLLRFNFIFFVPAYVSITGNASPLAFSMVALAGPAINLILFLTSWALLQQKKLKKNIYLFLVITKQINLFLFIFNMLPIPLFDGFKVYSGLFQTFF